jgi:hypothetical protein
VINDAPRTVDPEAQPDASRRASQAGGGVRTIDFGDRLRGGGANPLWVISDVGGGTVDR